MSLLRWDSWELPAQAADCFLSEDGFEPKVAPFCATTPDAESPLLRRASSFGKEVQQASEPQPPAQAPVYRPASPPPLWSLLDQPVLNPQNQPTVLPLSCHSLAQLQYGAHSGLGPLLGLCASLCATSQPKCPNSWGGLSMMPHSPAPRRTTPVMPPACCEPTNSAGFSATTSPVHRISYFSAAALGLPVSAVMQHQQAMHRQDSGVEQHVMAASSSPSGACHMLKSGSLLSGITSATLSHTDVLLASDQDEDEDDAKSSLMMVGAKRKAGVALGGAVKKVAPSKRNNGRVVCRNCGAQQTPQWRCGPEGPRTLCNACGVRFKKGLPLPYWEAKKKARVSLV